MDAVPAREAEDIAELIRQIVGNEWYSQYSITVLGPRLDDDERNDPVISADYYEMTKELQDRAEAKREYDG